MQGKRGAIAAVVLGSAPKPDRYALEPKVDGVRALVAFDGDRLEVRGRRNGTRRSWLACWELHVALDGLAEGIPLVRDGTVLEGEL